MRITTRSPGGMVSCPATRAAKVVIYSLALFSATAAAAAQTCYGSDGTALDDSFVPCYPSQGVSSCCASNKKDGDICLSSGVCYAQIGGYRGFMYVNGCTDKTGRSPNCPTMCPNSGSSSSWNVLPCVRGTFCCRKPNDTEDCCDKPDQLLKDFDVGTLLVGSLEVSASGPAPTASSTSSVKTESSSSPTSSSASTPSAANSSCPKDKSGVIGGALGGVLGAALLGAIAAIVVLLRQRRRQYSEPQPQPQAYYPGAGSEAPEVKSPYSGHATPQIYPGHASPQAHPGHDMPQAYSGQYAQQDYYRPQPPHELGPSTTGY